MDGYLTKPTNRELLAKEIERVSGQETVAPEPEVSAAQKETSPVDWNMQELLERVEGDRQFLRELLVMFREDSQSTMEKAKAAMQAGDLPKLSREAHGMKGMLKNLAMGGAAELASALETAARDGFEIESEELLAKLEQLLTQILPEVEAQMIEVQA